MSKYGNIKTYTTDGKAFDSRKEAHRYGELKLMERAGLIKDLHTQVKFELIPKQKGERACAYVADFVYTDCETGQKVVEDVKSAATKKKESYIIKRKLMLYVHGIKLKET